MMILNAKNGQINVLENPDESPDSMEIMDLSEGPEVCTNGERGLHTVIPSPNFAKNRHLFAFFTKYKEDCLEDPEEGPHNVVVRFTMDPDTLMLDYDEGTLIFRGECVRSSGLSLNFFFLSSIMLTTCSIPICSIYRTTHGRTLAQWRGHGVW